MASIIKEACSAAEQQHVESALAAYYLRSDGPFGAGALRYIDASPSQLAMALSLDESCNPVKELGRACGGAQTMSRVLAHGMVSQTKAADAPGFFRFLVMTCAIVATADGNDRTQEFGENLALAFDSPNLFTNRAALPGLWARLQSWCNRQREGGVPLRKVVLPEPGAGKHLGLTNAISFPGWRDVNRLRSLLERRSHYVTISNPIAAAKLLCPRIKNDSKFSASMQLASDEYEKLYFAKASLLELHRFWLALRHALQLDGTPRRVNSSFPRLELRFCSHVEDAELQVTVIDAKGVPLSDKRLEGCADDVLRLLRQWLAQHALSAAGASLCATVDGGLIPFLEERFGLWVSKLSPPELPMRCMLLVSKKKSDFAREWRIEATPIGEEWMLVGPLPVRETLSVYQYLGYTNGEFTTSLPQALLVSGGYKTAAGLLGRVSLLPSIIVKGPGVPSLKGAASDRNEPSLTKNESPYWRITATCPLEGPYTVLLEEDILPGAEPLAVEKTLSFFPDALEHVGLPHIDDTHWKAAPETCKHEFASLPTVALSAPGDDMTDPRAGVVAQFDDFLEAVYAGGRSGWAEQDLISAMREILGPSTPSPWDIVRGLTECGWLLETSNLQWRARRWWLCPPLILRIRLADGSEALLLRGSAPAVVRRRFAETVFAAGCTVDTRRGVGDYSALSLLATGPRLQAVVDELGWTVRDAIVATFPPAPHCWPMETVDESRHRPVAKWAWERGAFDKRLTSAPDVVAIERFRRERGDREDLFVVCGNGIATRFVTASRVIAISEAYRRMSAPLFEHKQSLLVRIPKEGHLVQALASEAITRACRNSGPTLIDGRWAYAYPADSYFAHKVRKLFGSSFVISQFAVTIGSNMGLAPQSFAYLRHRKIFRADGRGASLTQELGDAE